MEINVRYMECSEVRFYTVHIHLKNVRWSIKYGQLEVILFGMTDIDG